MWSELTPCQQPPQCCCNIHGQGYDRHPPCTVHFICHNAQQPQSFHLSGTLTGPVTTQIPMIQPAPHYQQPIPCPNGMQIHQIMEPALPQPLMMVPQPPPLPPIHYHQDINQSNAYPDGEQLKGGRYPRQDVFNPPIYYDVAKQQEKLGTFQEVKEEGKEKDSLEVVAPPAPDSEPIQNQNSNGAHNHLSRMSSQRGRRGINPRIKHSGPINNVDRRQHWLHPDFKGPHLYDPMLNPNPYGLLGSNNSVYSPGFFFNAPFPPTRSGRGGRGNRGGSSRGSPGGVRSSPEYELSTKTTEASTGNQSTVESNASRSNERSEEESKEVSEGSEENYEIEIPAEIADSCPEEVLHEEDSRNSVVCKDNWDSTLPTGINLPSAHVGLQPNYEDEEDDLDTLLIHDPVPSENDSEKIIDEHTDYLQPSVPEDNEEDVEEYEEIEDDFAEELSASSHTPDVSLPSHIEPEVKIACKQIKLVLSAGNDNESSDQIDILSSKYSSAPNQPSRNTPEPELWNFSNGSALVKRTEEDRRIDEKETAIKGISDEKIVDGYVDVDEKGIPEEDSSIKLQKFMSKVEDHMKNQHRLHSELEQEILRDQIRREEAKDAARKIMDALTIKAGVPSQSRTEQYSIEHNEEECSEEHYCLLSESSSEMTPGKEVEDYEEQLDEYDESGNHLQNRMIATSLHSSHGSKPSFLINGENPVVPMGVERKKLYSRVVDGKREEVKDQWNEEGKKSDEEIGTMVEKDEDEDRIIDQCVEEELAETDKEKSNTHKAMKISYSNVVKGIGGGYCSPTPVHTLSSFPVTSTISHPSTVEQGYECNPLSYAAAARTSCSTANKKRKHSETVRPILEWPKKKKTMENTKNGSPSSPQSLEGNSSHIFHSDERERPFEDATQTEFEGFTAVKRKSRTTFQDEEKKEVSRYNQSASGEEVDQSCRSSSQKVESEIEEDNEEEEEKEQNPSNMPQKDGKTHKKKRNKKKNEVNQKKAWEKEFEIIREEERRRNACQHFLIIVLILIFVTFLLLLLSFL